MDPASLCIQLCVPSQHLSTDDKDYKPAIPEEGGYMAEGIIYSKLLLLVSIVLVAERTTVAVYKAIGGHVEDHRSDSDDNNKRIELS